MADENTIGQVRVDIARLEGMVLQSLTDSVRRIDALEKDRDQLRIDFTAVANLVGIHTANIAEIRQDITEVNLRQNAMLGRAMSVASPLLALSSLIYSVFVAGNHN